jgi:hypothetical protein
MKREDGSLDGAAAMPSTTTLLEHYGNTASIKLALRTLCGGDDALCEVIQEVALRMCDLEFEAKHLMHVYMRMQFEKDSHMPEFTWQRIVCFMRAVASYKGVLEPPSAYDKELSAARDEYLRLREKAGLPPVSRDGLTGNLLGEAARRMSAAISTHIQQHFVDVQLRYLRLRLSVAANQSDMVSISDGIAEQHRINGAAVHGGKDLSLPDCVQVSVEYSLLATPERFLLPLYRMNRFFEEHTARKSAVLPLSSGFVPGAYMHIDTQGLRGLLRDKRLVHLRERVAVYDAALNERLGKQPNRPTTTAASPFDTELQQRLKQLKCEQDIVMARQHSNVGVTKSQLKGRRKQLVQKQLQFVQQQLQFIQRQKRFISIQPQYNPLLKALEQNADALAELIGQLKQLQQQKRS